MYRVLIVEDEALFRKVLTKIIEDMEGYQVIGTLEDGGQVLDFCEQEHPDFICMDILLPGENGLSLSQKVKERYPSILIFILSAYQDFNTIQLAMEAGADAYLTKPYKKEGIKRAFLKYQNLFEKEEDERKEIARSVSSRKICDSYLLCRRFSEEIFQQSIKEPERSKRLNQMAGYCLDYMGTLTAGKRNHYEKKYRLAPDIHKYQCLAEIYLQFLIREIYRLQMISRYPQFNIVLSHIHKNLDKELTLNEMAKMCGMSPGYITRIFKRYYGIGAVDYIHLTKVIWARLYLACTELSISDISYSFGYNDPGYFGKVFKKYEGTTPSAYKKEHDCCGYNIAGGFGGFMK